MVTIYTSFVNTLLENANRSDVIDGLPLKVREKIAAYASPQDRALRLTGKMLLRALLEKHVPEQPDLYATLEYDELGKPFFPTHPIAFSMAHSGKIAVCAFSDDGEAVGIDIEEEKPVAFQDIEDYLTEKERSYLLTVPNFLPAFYQLWTRKEAVLKASGKGVGIPFSKVDALNSPVFVNEIDWHWQPIAIAAGYSAHLASSSIITAFEHQNISF